MDISEHTKPDRLERYAFLWSIARLVIAALSLFFGAVPLMYRLGVGSSAISTLMPLFWLVSGAAAIYLLWLWHKGGQKLFGGTNHKDKVMFLIMAVTGINLAYAAIGSNVGMSLVWDMPIADILFKLTAIVYLFVAWHLWKQWSAFGETLFGVGATSVASAPEAPASEVPQNEGGTEEGAEE